MDLSKCELHLTFPEPISGFWNGGAKDGGVFRPEAYDRHPKSGDLVQWGCFGLNFFFNVKCGDNPQQALAIAKRKLQRICKVQGKRVKAIIAN